MAERNVAEDSCQQQMRAGSSGSGDSAANGGRPRYSQIDDRSLPVHLGTGKEFSRRTLNVSTAVRASDSHSIPGTTANASILIIDDCALYREALAANFATHGITNVRSAWDLPSLISVLEGAEPNVILLNIATRDLHLILRAVTSLNPEAPVIAIATSEDDESAIIACAEAGVAGYQLRTESFADLMVLVGTVVSGKVSCPPKISAILLRRLSVLASQGQHAAKDPVLTTRESQILEMLELGRSNQDIADQLCIAVHTVKNHVHSLLTKLGVSTRAEAAALSHSIRTDRDAHRRTSSRSNQNWS